MTKGQYLEEFNGEYLECVKAIKEMTQEELISHFSKIKEFLSYIEDDEEDTWKGIQGDFWPLAGTIVEAISVESAPCLLMWTGATKSLMKHSKTNLKESNYV